MLLIFLVVLLLPGLVGALMSRSFEPTPATAWLRYLVTASAAAAGAALVVTLGSDWWVVDDYEREETLLTEGTSGFPIFFVAMGLVACLLTVLAARGRRNWAPMAFTLLWLLLAGAWYSSTGEPVDSDAGGEALPGLELATWATLGGTGAALVGSLGRLAERRSVEAAATPAAAAEPHRDRPEARPGRGLDVTAGDVLAAIGVAALCVLSFLGVGPDPLGDVVFLLAIVAVVVRGGSLVARHRRGAR